METKVILWIIVLLVIGAFVVQALDEDEQLRKIDKAIGELQTALRLAGQKEPSTVGKIAKSPFSYIVLALVVVLAMVGWKLMGRKKWRKHITEPGLVEKKIEAGEETLIALISREGLDRDNIKEITNMMKTHCHDAFIAVAANELVLSPGGGGADIPTGCRRLTDLRTRVENNAIDYPTYHTQINKWIEDELHTYVAEVLVGKSRDDWLKLMKELRNWSAGIVPR